ncbi:MAG: UDP-glucose/GDP-mannose dehydrogenase family protein [Nevskia sp.]|nr:UDP-glucose/GDP-mannose dehydrogenase family protein [Nevskia sp.]
MNISIFGLGYVGTVCAACLAYRGHSVVGVDISEDKVRLVNSGRSPIVEPGVAELLGGAHSAGRIRATREPAAAVLETELSLICVGTPSRRNGDLDLHHVEEVAREIGVALRNKTARHTVVVRSTVLPGTVRGGVIPLLERSSGKRAGVDFDVAVNPEFLREGSAIDDYWFPEVTLIGEMAPSAGDRVAALYADLPGKIVRDTLEAAEMIKYACNAWHASKITFANEIGAIAKSLGVDGRTVMDVVCQDRKLNISDAYMRPAFAFGGSCLPKDLRALKYRAERMDLPVPMLSSIMASNHWQIRRAFELVESFESRRVGLLGLSFKAGTDDLRESPLVELAQMLIDRGYQVSIFDRNVDYARVHGANRDFIDSRISHISALLKSTLPEVVHCSDIIVVGHRSPEFEDLVDSHGLGGRKVVDLAGVSRNIASDAIEGICW